MSRDKGQPSRKYKNPVVGIRRDAYDIAVEIARRDDKTLTDMIADAVLFYAESIDFKPRKARGWASE